jgi:hypothetical protein
LKLPRAARAQLLKLITNAAPLNGTFFRSVAFRYFQPDDLISGEGTRQYGGRFVPVGVRAVFPSAEEETALREVTQRKTTLGGERQIDVGEYPRMIYLSGDLDPVWSKNSIALKTRGTVLGWFRRRDGDFAR